MFRSMRLALALVQIPHLALSLFLFPLIISLALVFAQLVATGMVVRVASIDSAAMVALDDERADYNMMRWVLYGSTARRPAIQVCRWQAVGGGEVPPSKECNPDRLDVAIHVKDPTSYDVAHYSALFDGHVDKIHVCRTCTPDVIITPGEGGAVASQARSIFGLTILFLPYTNRSISSRRVEVFRTIEEIRKAVGSITMDIPESAAGIGISSLKSSLPITANIASLVLISLWLALRAHRKVLDYFSQNDVLLPLAAACGKERFYGSIWILTMLRVGCFLGASIPLMYFGLKDVLGDDASLSEMPVSFVGFGVWILALVSTLSFATMIASIAELKHRQALWIIVYRFLPMTLAVVGAAVWSFSFILPYHALGTLRLILSSIPVVGMAPIFVAPAINLPLLPMVVHAILASAMFLVLLQRNARWFAAHLEEV
jgi:hypothetical protein